MQFAMESPVGTPDVSERRAKLVDEIRALEAQIAGKRIEFCMAIGDRESAERYRKDMYATIEARKAAIVTQSEDSAGCYFEAMGRADGLS